MYFRVTGLETTLKATHLAEWSAVNIWNPEARYNPAGLIAPADAILMVNHAKPYSGFYERASNKLMLIEIETAKERGGYDLFALFLRGDTQDKWDIIIAADWLKDNKGEALQYVSSKVQGMFNSR